MHFISNIPAMKNISIVVQILVFSLTAKAVIAQEDNYQQPSLPAPFATKSSMKFSKVVGWKDDEKPKAPGGFSVSSYAADFQNPRWIYVLPNGDVLVAESNSNHSFFEKIGASIIGASKSNSMKSSADRITLLRDRDKNGVVDFRSTFLAGLNQPFGMLFLNGWLYVANTDAIVRFPYKDDQTSITASSEKLVDLPGGARHWTKSMIANKEGTRIYIGVGSSSNIAERGIEKELLRANILQMSPDGKDLKVYASGLRNPVGMDWSSDGTLWTVVNERDELGDDLVPDYLTHVESEGFYGWPYLYWGNHPDPRVKDQKPEAAVNVLTPDVSLGAHTASLGLAFYSGNAFPERYRNGAFIGQHGSWNRSTLSGYKVVFVPFQNGKPSGKPEDFLTGFVTDLAKRKVHGRPVGVTNMPDGSLLVADDKSNVVWRIVYEKK
ncbi:sorbosone dehydrogenase family protein [soil metagenome]